MNMERTLTLSGFDTQSNGHCMYAMAISDKNYLDLDVINNHTQTFSYAVFLLAFIWCLTCSQVAHLKYIAYITAKAALLLRLSPT